MIKSIERIVCGALLLAFLSCGDDAGETGPAGGRGLVTFTATAGDTGTRSTQDYIISDVHRNYRAKWGRAVYRKNIFIYGVELFKDNFAINFRGYWCV